MVKEFQQMTGKIKMRKTKNKKKHEGKKNGGKDFNIK